MTEEMNEMTLLRQEFLKCYNELVRIRELVDSNSDRISELEGEL